MRQRIIRCIELLHLLWKHKKWYFDYVLHKKQKLYKQLKQLHCKRIKAVQLLEWKVNYGSYYFHALFENKNVFVKVTSKWTKDGYFNEIACNNYIQNHSKFLAERSPTLFVNTIYDDFYILIFERFDIIKGIKNDEVQDALNQFISEYSRIGIIHQDLKPSNITIHDNKYCIIDYGFSICPNSNDVRVATNNYIKHITNAAKELLETPDYYYDDAIASNVTKIDRETLNFIVSNNDKCLIRLAGIVHEFQIQKLPGRSVSILHRR